MGDERPEATAPGSDAPGAHDVPGDLARRQPISVDAASLPATGAWRPGQPVGDRQFVSSPPGRRFLLEGGGHLPGVEIAYETWGTLASDKSNAVLVCHALTGDSHAAGHAGVGHQAVGWWDDVIGPGRALDTDELFVVCANVLGGCQGSTGPATIDPDGRPWGRRFPVVSIRDMVRAQAMVADHLGVTRWRSVVGGSMGGMQVLEWALMYPERVGSIVPIATTVAASAQQIAYSSVQRFAIALDPAFAGGDYYDAPPGGGPHRGLALAREIAQITYRSDEVFQDRFGRGVVDPIDDAFALWQRFAVEGYLDYHGAKLVRRFDANSYLTICKAMDLHDIGRGRAGAAAAMARLRCPVLVMSITSDALYPPWQQRQIRDLVTQVGGRCELVDIDSPHGHDAFLLEEEQVGDALRKFLQHVEDRPGA